MLDKSSPADTSSPVPLLDVARSNEAIREKVLEAIAEVYDSGRFLFGSHVAQLESEIAALSNTKYAVGCASGSDALLLSLMALGISPGDEVIVPSFSFFATASCVSRLGAKIVFADIDAQTYNIDPEEISAKITPRTRAIIPVHLFGQAAQIDAICRLASEHEIPVVEDAAQAIGAAYHGRPVGSWGQTGCISFYPTKNLGGFGDGGMLTTNSEIIADRLRLLSGHGMRPRYHHSEVGINSRLDSFQAAGLCVKLELLESYTTDRRANANYYTELLTQTGVADTDGATIGTPYQDSHAYHVWNQYSLRVGGGKRDALREFLAQHQVGTEIYYPIPLHLQECYRSLGYQPGSLPVTEKASQEILHLPIFPGLARSEQERVVELIVQFCRANQLQAA